MDSRQRSENGYVPIKLYGHWQENFTLFSHVTRYFFLLISLQPRRDVKAILSKLHTICGLDLPTCSRPRCGSRLGRGGVGT